MKERHLFTLLSVEAAACVLFCILQRSLSGLFSTLIAFPFEQIGAGLRVLSLSGAVGNVIAIILYMLLGLIPAGIWVFLHWRKKSEPLDFMLLVISALLFCNPILHDQSGTFIHRSARHREMVPGKYLLFRPSGLPAYPYFASL